jgi:hypothetical protein
LKLSGESRRVSDLLARLAVARYAVSKATQKGHIMQVDVPGLVAFVKSPLLFERKTPHPPSSDHALGEAMGRVVEMTAAKVGLSAVSVRPEHDRVKVYPSPARCNKLDAHWTPVGLYLVADAPQRPNGG